MLPSHWCSRRPRSQSGPWVSVFEEFSSKLLYSQLPPLEWVWECSLCPGKEHEELSCACCWKTSQCPPLSWLLAFRRVEGWRSSELRRQLWMSRECVLLLWYPGRYWQLTERFMWWGFGVLQSSSPHVETELCFLTTFNEENVWGLVLQMFSLF